MTIRHILIDLDGVLADFVGRALEIHGRDAAAMLDNWPPGEYDVAKVIGISENAFWKKIDLCMAFWNTLTPYPWIDALLTCCSEFADWTICTSPSRSSRSAEGKVQWIQRHFGRDFRQYVVGPKFVEGEFAPYMQLMARPDVVLIDDSDANCEAFERAGGRAILFPQPWNSAFQFQELRASRIFFVCHQLSLIQGGHSHGKARTETQGGKTPQEGHREAVGTTSRGQDDGGVPDPRPAGEEAPQPTR